MKKAISLLIVTIITLFCFAGCGKTITGEMITEGKVIAFSEKELRQEKGDGKIEFMGDIINMSNHRSKISESLNNKTSIRIFWRLEMDTGTDIRKNTIIKIE